MDINNITVKMPEHIFLFGHRKQHGKDTCCDFAEEILADLGVGYCRTFFAKKLKEMAADEYNLDLSLMEDNDYKCSSPAHLNGKTVRDILIEIGNRERSKDKDCWVRYAFKDIFESKQPIGLISDFRFPNEAAAIPSVATDLFSHICDKAPHTPMSMTAIQVHKVLVHRPDGVFVSDGADDQLPDLQEPIDEDDNSPGYWDHVIINDDTSDRWKESLKSKVAELLNDHVQIRQAQ